MSLLGALGLLLSPAPAVTQGAAESVIVVLRDDADARAVASAAAQEHAAEVSHVYEYALKGFAARVPAARLNALRSDPRVKYVEPDGISYAITAPWEVNTGGGAGGGVGTIAGQVLPAGINHIEADQSSTLAGDGRGSLSEFGRVAVIDTGVAAHADLYLAGGYNCTTGNKNDYRDLNGHGTHVAGTIAAKDNGSDVVGVAPGAPLYAVKVLNSQGWGYNSWIIAGCNWVASPTGGGAVGIKVANMSLGGAANQAIDDAVKGMVNKGVTVVVAAGNDGKPIANYSPARLAGVNGVVVVEALADSDGIRGNDGRASFSNVGGDVIAPGVNILSARLTSGTTTMSGTSMATPHVAGAALHAVKVRPGALPATIESDLKAHCQGTIANVPVACVAGY